MEKIKILFVFSALLAVGIKSENEDSSMQQCKVGDNECVASLMNVFFERSGDGIPQFDLVPTNPYEVQNIVVEQGKESPVNIKIQFLRANITGIHLFHVDQVMGFNKDPRKSKFEMRGTVKVASIRGPYEMSGKFLLLPISGRGLAEMTFENVKLRIKFKGKIQTKDGKDYILLDEVLIKMEPEKFRMNFQNLFNNKQLSDNMNAVLNENSDLVYKELQVPIQRVMGETLKIIYAPVARKFSYTDIFMKDD